MLPLKADLHVTGLCGCICTCGSSSSTYHAQQAVTPATPTCELWNCDGWVEMHTDWDVEEQRLVPVQDTLAALAEADEAWWAEVLEDYEGDELVGSSDQVVTDDRDAIADNEWECLCKPQAQGKWCSTCEVKRVGKSVSDPLWNTWEDDSDYYKQYLGTWQKCRHYMQETKFPDGTIVYPSSLFSAKDREEGQWPDFGCYFASSWRPVTLAYQVEWPDQGIPDIPMSEVQKAVDDVIARAKAGQKVEFGCIGGHGRTGTFMALLVMQCGIKTPHNAIKWVHKNYCKEAIESESQEWYIKAFHAWRNGKPIPKKPEPKKWSSTWKCWRCKTDAHDASVCKDSECYKCENAGVDFKGHTSVWEKCPSKDIPYVPKKHFSSDSTSLSGFTCSKMGCPYRDCKDPNHPGRKWTGAKAQTTA